MRLSVVCFLALGFPASAVALPTIADALPIEFSYKGVGSGNIGDINFANTMFEFTALGNTGSRVPFTGPFPYRIGYSITHSAAQIQLDGIGTFQIQTPTRTFVNNDTSAAGLSRAVSQNLDLWIFNDPRFSTWDMLSDLGPFDAPSTLRQWTFDVPVVTDAGILRFDNATVRGIFSANVIPEPCTATGAAVLMLLLVGSSRLPNNRSGPNIRQRRWHGERV